MSVSEVEMWVDVAGYEGLYEVSSEGRVRSLPRQTRCGILGGKLLAPRVNSQGRAYISLCRDGGVLMSAIHRLVALAFLQELPGKPHVNHRNGDPLDNRLRNLEWCSSEENLRHSVCHGMHTPPFGFRPVHQLDPKTGEVLRTFHSLHEAARSVGGKHSSIRRVAVGGRKTSAGFGWAFAGGLEKDFANVA